MMYHKFLGKFPMKYEFRIIENIVKKTPSLHIIIYYTI